MEFIKKDNNVYVNIYNKSENVFENKIILITGGSSGIGYATAKLCIQSGATVIVTGRSLDKLKKAQRELGEKCFISQFDVADIARMNAEIDRIWNKFGRIDHFVSNAGLSTLKRTFDGVDEEEWERIISVHMKGNYFIMRNVFQKMVSHGICGNIVAVSSNGSFTGHLIPYGMAKAGLNNFVAGLAKVSISHGIRCNAVAPGYTVTKIFEERGMFPGLDAKDNLYKGDIRGNRFHLPEEIAEVILFLLSDRSSCINGQVIVCDSGDTVL